MANEWQQVTEPLRSQHRDHSKIRRFKFVVEHGPDRGATEYRRDSRSSDGPALPAIAEKGNGLKITEQEVRRVADLANLALRDDEVARMAQDLDGILTHIDKLNELDTANVEPMAQVLFDAEETATLREDQERPTLTNAEAVGNAAVTSGGYYKVPRVIER